MPPFYFQDLGACLLWFLWFFFRYIAYFLFIYLVLGFFFFFLPCSFICTIFSCRLILFNLLCLGSLFSQATGLYFLLPLLSAPWWVRMACVDFLVEGPWVCTLVNRFECLYSVCQGLIRWGVLGYLSGSLFTDGWVCAILLIVWHDISSTEACWKLYWAGP